MRGSRDARGRRTPRRRRLADAASAWRGERLWGTGNSRHRGIPSSSPRRASRPRHCWTPRRTERRSEARGVGIETPRPRGRAARRRALRSPSREKECSASGKITCRNVARQVDRKRIIVRCRKVETGGLGVSDSRKTVSLRKAGRKVHFLGAAIRGGRGGGGGGRREGRRRRRVDETVMAFLFFLERTQTTGVIASSAPTRARTRTKTREGNLFGFVRGVVSRLESEAVVRSLIPLTPRTSLRL